MVVGSAGCATAGRTSGMYGGVGDEPPSVGDWSGVGFWFGLVAFGQHAAGGGFDGGGVGVVAVGGGGAPLVAQDVEAVLQGAFAGGGPVSHACPCGDGVWLTLSAVLCQHGFCQRC